MKIEKLKKIYHKVGIIVWLFKTDNDRAANVLYDSLTGSFTITIGNVAGYKNNHEVISGKRIIEDHIKKGLFEPQSLEEAKKIIENIPGELVDMLLTVKGC